MYVCIHTYISMYVRMHIHTYVRMYIHTYILHSLIQTHTQTHTSLWSPWPLATRRSFKKNEKNKKTLAAGDPGGVSKMSTPFPSPIRFAWLPCAQREREKEYYEKKMHVCTLRNIYRNSYRETHTHTHTHARTRARTHTHTHTHKHQHINVGIYTGPQWWRYRGQDATLVPSRSVCLPPLTPLVRV